MSKRKTRQEKIISDLRRKLQTTQPISSLNPITPSVKTTKETYTILPQKKFLVVYDTPYIIADLRKISVLTFAILAFEIALYILLQKHIISLANLRF